MTERVPVRFFVPVDTGAMVRACTDVMIWVQRNPRYFDHIKAKFAADADGLLVADARVHRAVVVTDEQSAPASSGEVTLPDARDQFGVERDNTFSMLRALDVRLNWGEDGWLTPI